MDPKDLSQEIAELRHQLRRNQVYLTAALAVVGLGTLIAVGLVALHGLRLGDQLWNVRAKVDVLEDESEARTKALSLDFARQQQELAAIRKSADDDLAAIREANRKIASIRDPGQELAALRDANEALWTELASQRAELLDALDALAEPDVTLLDTEPVNVPERFQLGDTDFVDVREPTDEIKGFVVTDEVVYKATGRAAKPAHLLIELTPSDVRLGEPFALTVRLVNRSNRPLDAHRLRLDWSFAGKNTGGDVPLGVGRVEPRADAILYQMSGRWSPAHEDGSVAITATLSLAGGGRLANTLRW